MSSKPDRSEIYPGLASPRRWLLCAMLILLIAAIFRLVLLDEVPPGLAQDEVLDADIATFIREGEHALFFSHGYGHEPLYHYWAVPFQILFGDNILGIRLPSVFLGLLLVALTMRWARRDYGTIVALVAGMGLAVSWWPIIFSRIGIRPILEPVLLVLAVWFWPLRVVHVTHHHIRSAALAGLWIGLSIYTYTAARIVLLIPTLMLVILVGQYLWIKWRPARSSGSNKALQAQLIYAVIVLGVGLMVYLPLAITLRANPDLQQRIEQLEGPLTSFREGDLAPVMQMSAATAGVFSVTGDPRWTYSLPNRSLFDPLTALFFYVGLGLAIWRWRRPVYLLLPVWLVVTCLPSALSPDAPSTVRLVGALPVVYLLPGLAVDAGARWLVSKRKTTAVRDNRGSLLIATLLGLVLITNGFRTIRDGFVRWPQDIETRLRYQTVLRDIGRHWRAAGTTDPPVVVEAYFEPIDRDSLRRNIGIDPEARWLQTGAGVAGALVWPDGEAAALYVPEYAPIEDELLALGGVSDEPILRSDGQPSFALYQLSPYSPGENDSLEVGFGQGGMISLLGVTPPEMADNGLQLASWWRVGDNLPADLAIFVHLVDSTGSVVAQFDGLDAAPISLVPGDILLQRHKLHFPEPKIFEQYVMRLGVYQRSTGDRLYTENGLDSIELATCEVGSDASSGLSCRLTRND